MPFPTQHTPPKVTPFIDYIEMLEISSDPQQNLALPYCLFLAKLLSKNPQKAQSR